MAPLSLTLLPITVQWFRRQGTDLDLAPLVDHYVALAVQPLNEQIETLKEMERTRQAKVEAFRAAIATAAAMNDAEA